MPIDESTLKAVADQITGLYGFHCAIEYPGYLAIPIGYNRIAAFGGDNPPNWTGNTVETDPEGETYQAIPMAEVPLDAEVDRAAVAIVEAVIRFTNA